MKNLIPLKTLPKSGTTVYIPNVNNDAIIFDENNSTHIDLFNLGLLFSKPDNYDYNDSEFSLENWKSVEKDGLPKKNGEYLVFINCYFPYLDVYSFNKKRNVWIEEDKDYFSSKESYPVTHYISLNSVDYPVTLNY